MEDVTKTPNLHLRKGTYYYRARVPNEVREVIAANHQIWIELTKGRLPLMKEWKLLSGSQCKLKNEVWLSLGVREARSARKALALKQVEMNKIFDSIVACLSGRLKPPSNGEIDALFMRWSKGVADRRREQAIRTSLEFDGGSEIYETLGMDLAFAQSTEPEEQISYHQTAKQLLLQNGYSINESAQHYKTLVYLIKCFEVQSAKEALSINNFEPPANFLNGIKSVEHARHTFNDTSAAITNSITLRELTQLFFEDRQKSIKAKTAQKYASLFRILGDVLGNDRQISSIKREECREVQRVFGSLPSNYNKHKVLRSLKAGPAARKATEISMKPMSVVTANDYLHKFRLLFEWAVQEDYLTRNPATKLHLSESQTAAEDKVPAYTIDELQTVFSSGVYSATHPTVEDRGSKYWVPLIALFSGLRLNEILQMYVSDMKMEDGCHYFSINLQDESGAIASDKSLKRNSSRRRVPIHSMLMHLGFLSYYKSIKLTGATRLFPDAPMGKDNTYSSPFSKWFARSTANIGISKQRSPFHRFRHTFRDAMRRARLNDEEVKSLGGWAIQNSSDLYGSGLDIKSLSNAMEKVNYPGLDLSHLKRSQQ